MPQQESYSAGNSMQFAPQPTNESEYYRGMNEAPQDQYAQYRAGQYPPGFNSYEQEDQYNQHSRREKHVLQKPHRKFPDGYENEAHGSGGRAKRVMDFFRMRGKARGGE
jgi:protein-serine/threonine kinase